MLGQVEIAWLLLACVAPELVNVHLTENFTVESADGTIEENLLGSESRLLLLVGLPGLAGGA